MFTGSRPWAGMSHRQILAVVSCGGCQLEWVAHPAIPPTYRPIAESLVQLGVACCSYRHEQRPTMADIEEMLGCLEMQAAQARLDG
jgi:hypothetical protein